jgi:hypothetical protein
MLDDESRARALTALVPQVPGSERVGVLGEALAAARAIDDEGSRAGALAEMTVYLEALPDDDLVSFWLMEFDGLNLLHSLARRQRRDLLSDLSALAPILSALGGAEAVAGTLRAIQDVGRWWP